MAIKRANNELEPMYIAMKGDNYYCVDALDKAAFLDGRKIIEKINPCYDAV